MKKFEMAVVEACGLKNLDEVTSLSQRELVDEVILPQLFHEGGINVRYSRISGVAMQFLADWGEELLARDRFTGELLLELGLQRLSMGAVKHEPMSLREIFSRNEGYEMYLPYSAALDEPDVMHQECWNFIHSQMKNCLSICNGTFKKHAEAILIGLLTNISPDGPKGKPLNRFAWNGAYVDVTLKEIWLWALQMAEDQWNKQFIALLLAPTWYEHMYFFKKYKDELRWPLLWTSFNLSEEANLRYVSQRVEYFSPAQRFFLKLFGRYDLAIKEKSKKVILEEISRYDMEVMRPTLMGIDVVY